MADDVAQQIEIELRLSVQRALRNKRPLLTHLNADTTWLIQLPRPEGSKPARHRSYFNILLDPWLSGPQSDVASWFSTQYHAFPASVSTIAELEDLLLDIEILADPTLARQKNSPRIGSSSLIDIVAISHEFTDHCHQATLQEIDPSVTVIASEKAAELIRSWEHFDHVCTAPTFSAHMADWRNTSIGALPPWIGISRIVSPGNAFYYHSAIMITFNSTSDEARKAPMPLDSQAEAIIYTPHGINADDLVHLQEAAPTINTLALLHGLHDVGLRMMQQLNLGAGNGLRAQRICRAKYWVGTHDEVKPGIGLITPFLRRAALTIEDALEKEGNAHSDAKGVNFVELGNGETFMLE